MKVTQKDIAKKLGVSTSLVSRVLSGRAEEIGIRRAMIEEVEALAKKLRYVPSSAALALRGKKSSTIGVVVYDFNDPFFSKVISELQKIAQEENYSILLVGFLNRAVSESSLRPLYKHIVDGIIIVGSHGDLKWLDAFSDIPVSRIGHGTDTRLSFGVSVDENSAMKEIAKHLISQKIKSAVFARRATPVHAQREIAFLNEFNSAGISNAYARNSRSLDELEAGVEIVSKILEDKLPEAIVCASDTLAMGVIRALKARGISVPADVVVTGFDDISAASTFIPSITTYCQAVEKMARKAFLAVAKEDVAGREQEFEGELIVRESSKRKRAK